MHIRLEEGYEVWPSLADNEVIDIEKLRDSR